MNTLFIGTYTRGTAADGIYRTAWNPQHRAFAPVTLAAVADNPSFLIRAGAHLFAVHETGDFEGQAQGAVAAYALAGAGLRLLAARGTGGADPCHLAAGHGVLAVANYSGGSVACFGLTDAGLGALRWRVTFTGSSGVPGTRGRQSAPHPHGVYFEDGALWVPDLGLDCVHRLTLEGAADPDARLRLAPGSGPRQMVWSDAADSVQASTRAYVLAELGNRIDLLVDGVVRQSVSTLPLGGDPVTRHNTAGSIAWSPDRDVLFASNRGPDGGHHGHHNSLAAFRVDPLTGALADPVVTPCDAHPRHFAVLDDVVIVAARDAGTLTAFARVPGAGLGPTLASIAVPAPVCVLPW
ncbi:MAG: lactonase family protein [Gammaproteobacteria bacterium]